MAKKKTKKSKKRAPKKMAKKVKKTLKKLTRKAKSTPKKKTKSANVSRLKAIKKAYKKTKKVKKSRKVAAVPKKVKKIKVEPIAPKVTPEETPAVPESDDFRVYDDSHSEQSPVKVVVPDEKEEDYKDKDDYDFGFDHPDKIVEEETEEDPDEE